MRPFTLFSFIASLFFFVVPFSVLAQTTAQACIDNGGDPAQCQCEASGGAWNVTDGTCYTGGASGSWSSPASNTGAGTVQTSGGTSVGSSGGTTGTSVGQSGNTQPGTTVTLLNPLQGGGTLQSFLDSILAFVIKIGTVIVILMLVYVGYLFVVARGEPGKITEARQALLWTIVGALILLGAQAIAIGITATVNALSVGK